MIALVCAGRGPDDLAGEFEPAAQPIRSWVAQADHSEGRREDGPGGVSGAERGEPVRLRREARQLRLERGILSKAAAWSARETGATPSGPSGS